MNYFNILIYAVLLGVEFSLLIPLWHTFPLITKIAIYVVFGLTILYVLLILCRKIKNRKKRKRIMLGRINRALNTFLQNTSLALAIFFLLFPFYDFKVSENPSAPIIEIDSDKAVKFYDDSYSLPSIAEQIAPIRYQNTWDDLSKKEKLDILQLICNCEIHYLGISHPITVEISETLEENVRAAYYEPEHKIFFHPNNLENNKEALNSLLHEAYHAYQYELCYIYAKLTPQERALLCFENVDIYIENFNNYVSGGSKEYAYQQVEIDARDYAATGISDYFSAIDVY